MPFTGRHHRLGSPATPPPEPGRWSIPLGAWCGMPVRIHVSLAVVVVVFAGACLKPTLGWALAPLVLAGYLFSLMVHEGAHLAAAFRRHSGYGAPTPSGRGILLGPFGGIGYPAMPDRAEDRVFVAMAGPLANLAIVVAASCCLVLGGGPDGATLLTRSLANPAEMIVSGAPTAATPAATLACVLVVVNWPLFLVNLLPAAPLDGGVALRAWLTPMLRERAAAGAVLLIAWGSALCLLATAFLLGVVGDAAPLLSTTLAGLGVLVAFGAIDDLTTHDTLRRPDLFHEGLQDAPTDTYDAWDDDDWNATDGRNPGQAVVAFEAEPWDDGRVDDILAKLHSAGMEGLSDDEREVLRQASDHYRRKADPFS